MGVSISQTPFQEQVVPGNYAPNNQIDLALAASLCGLQTIHVGLSWSQASPTVQQVLLGCTAVFPPLQTCLRIGVQQRQLVTIPHWLMVLNIFLATASTTAKVTMTMISAFLSPSLLRPELYLLFMDYAVAAGWHWWLTAQTTSGSRTRSQVRYAACYVSFLSLVVIAVAIMGTIWAAWLWALEVRPTTASHSIRVPS
ncbi:hypothetical protein N7488_008962 [Penicillium malachiteum]|nr:hypothetical protein N7488_008962 [Penicillium malachiteum]